jgi:hypothetical protein
MVARTLAGSSRNTDHMTPFRLSIRALPLMVNNIKFGTLTRATASMRKHGIAGLNVPSDGQGNADHDLLHRVDLRIVLFEMLWGGRWRDVAIVA